MAHLIRMPRAAWRRQPSGPVTIARKNSLTRDLRIFATPCAGSMTECVQGNTALTETSIPLVTALGMARDYDNQQTVINPSPSYNILGPITIVAQVAIDALSNYSPVISCGAGTTSALPFEFRLGDTETSGKIVLIRANTGYRIRATSSNVVSAGNSYFVGVRQTGGMQGTSQAFVESDYYSLGSSGTGTGNATAGNGRLYIGKRNDGVTRLDGSILYVAAWACWLEDSEIKSFRENPWQIFQSRPARFILIPSAGGGSTVTAVAAIDALIQKTGIAQTLSLDALLQKSASATVSMDSLLAAAKTGLISFDALLQLARNTSVFIDALLLAVKSGTVSVDALILAAQTAGTSIDAILTGSSTPTQTAALDALILAAQTAGTSIDTLLLSEKTVSASLDALIGIVGTRTLSLDALLQAMKNGIISLDAVLQMASGVSVSLDALLQAGKTGSISVDAVLVFASGTSATLDAYIQASLSRGASLDAIIGAIAAAILPAGRVVGIDPSDRWITLSPSGRIVIT